MDADAEFDAALGRHARVALDETGLHLDRAADRIDHAAELDDAAVPGALDDAPVMHSVAASIRSLRRPRRRAKVRSSSAPASRL
jgi:hypothetical protein